MSYAPKLAAALSGATIRQSAYWRRPGPDGEPILAPEYSAVRPIDYSFRDVIALRTCVRLRQEASLQKIRRALDTLRVDLGQRDHLSSYQLVADGSTIYFADSDHAVDLLRQKGQCSHPPVCRGAAAVLRARKADPGSAGAGGSTSRSILVSARRASYRRDQDSLRRGCGAPARRGSLG